MRAFVFGGGEIFPEYIEERPEAGDIVICADSGYKNAQKMGVKVDILVGDFDSLGSIPDGVGEVLQVPREKNQTDTQLAVDIAIDRGAEEIIIVASTGGRCDHALSTMAVLEHLHAKKKIAYIVNGQNRVRYINSTSTLIPRSGYKYLSLLSLTEKAKGVSVEGCKYPLKNSTLKRSFQYAVSNEIVGNCALISVRRGGIYIIESIDK